MTYLLDRITDLHDSSNHHYVIDSVVHDCRLRSAIWEGGFVKSYMTRDKDSICV